MQASADIVATAMSTRMAAAEKPMVVATPSEWRLEVAAGPNAGAVIPLQAGQYRFGFDPSNDIVFADLGVAARQAVLDVDQARGIVLRPVASGIMIDDRAIGVGRRLKLRNGMDLTVGDTILHVHAPMATRRRDRRLVALLVVLPPAFILLLFVLLSPRVPALHSASSAASRASGQAISRVDAAMQELTRHLAQVGLAERLKLSSMGGAVLVAGRLTDAEMQRWKQAQRWYDATYGSTPALIAQITPASLALPDFGISAVSTGEVPYVITTSNQRFTEGAVLPGGWVITRIDQDEIILTRDGQTVRMEL
jgi:type III secretion protein D